MNEEQLKQALIKAHNAGDTEAAKLFADKIKQVRSIPSRGEAATIYSDAMAAGDSELAERAKQVVNYHMQNDFAGEKQARTAEQIGEMSGLDKFRTGMGRGFMDTGQGIKQVLLSAPPGLEEFDTGKADAYTKEKTEELQRFNALSEDSPWLAGSGRLAGGIASMPVPAAGGANALARVGSNAALGAGMAAAQFVPEGGSRLQNAALGATVGGALQGAGEGVKRVSNKLINARAGNINATDEAKDVLAFKQAYEAANGPRTAPVHADDLMQSGLVRSAGRAIDKVPFPFIGGIKDREAQNVAARSMAEKLKNQFLPDDQIDDLYGAVTKSAQDKLDEVKSVASKKYESAYPDLNAAGQFDLPQVRQQAADILNKAQSLGSMADEKLIGELQKIIDVPAGDFQHWAEVRSTLGATIRDARKGANENVGTKAIAALEQVKSGLEYSMDEVAAKIGGKGGKQWRDANKFYDDTVVQFKKGALQKALKEDNPERALNLLIGTGAGTGTDSAHVAKQLYNGLDPKGRDAVRYAMVEKAFTSALDDGDGIFNPAKFSSMLDRYSNRSNVFFNKSDKQMMDGMAKYMRAIKTAGSYGANIKTGEKVAEIGVPMVLTYGATVNMPLTAKVVGSSVVARSLLRTERGRSLMMAMSKTTPDSQQAADLINKINQYLVTRPAVLASSQQQPSQL